MKIGLLLAGVSCALSVSDELKELVNFDEWAHEALAEAPISGKQVKMETARAATRLRGLRTDLLSLLANLPERADDDESSGDNEETIDKGGSGDWMVDTEELLTSGEFNDDISMLVRHGLIDDVIANDDVVFSDEIEDDGSLEVNMLEENSKSKVKQVPYANLDDLPSFEKYESRRNPRLITGENRDNGKSQWLTLSVVGSLAAIVLTVTLTVFARRIKKGPNVNSGTPIQQMRRFNMQNGNGNVNYKPNPQWQNFNQFQNFNTKHGYDSGVHGYSSQSTNSSEIGSDLSSGRHSGSRQVNFSIQQNRPTRGYPNRNRALPPPPYSKIDY
ncbi:Oidioi.mRNA.OKI2018_I69.PAR.g9671.t1.cds [Oikopleura dioica]|uniref:Oidioi.mRNA.OKI2018_I69.PAR.g9671.t1.cds n=1 Tax=Oikopleura dioica TaxID=34765 RepID=A0ABN7RS38_OIKDI|nr:Oidioi.mRNA.OKI2018_I69.PAR.g9671.t1.cds [Oikopleura dioica]